MPKVHITINPEEEVEVNEIEYLELKNQGLISSAKADKSKKEN